MPEQRLFFVSSGTTWPRLTQHETPAQIVDNPLITTYLKMIFKARNPGPRSDLTTCSRYFRAVCGIFESKTAEDLGNYQNTADRTVLGALIPPGISD